MTIQWDWEPIKLREHIHSDHKRMGAILMMVENRFNRSVHFVDSLPFPGDGGRLELYWLAVVWNGEVASRVGVIEMNMVPGMVLSRKALRKGTFILA